MYIIFMTTYIYIYTQVRNYIYISRKLECPSWSFLCFSSLGGRGWSINWFNHTNPHHSHHYHPYPHPPDPHPHFPHPHPLPHLHHPPPHQESVLLWVTSATPRPAFVHPITQVLRTMIFWCGVGLRKWPVIFRLISRKGDPDNPASNDSPQLCLRQCRPSTGATGRAALPEAGLSAIFRSR